MISPCVPESEAYPNPEEHTVAPFWGKTPRTSRAIKPHYRLAEGMRTG